MANEFNLDKQEYQSVFKVFDKDNTGQIHINQVYDLIGKFDGSAQGVEEEKNKSAGGNAAGS